MTFLVMVYDHPATFLYCSRIWRPRLNLYYVQMRAICETCAEIPYVRDQCVLSAGRVVTDSRRAVMNAERDILHDQRDAAVLITGLGATQGAARWRDCTESTPAYILSTHSLL
jgi:hypothetical protein